MKILLFILIAYLLGSIPTGLWIGQHFFHINLRTHGSGNTGATNTFRILGKTAGSITLTIDILKGTLAVLLPIWFQLPLSPIFVGFFAIIGHVFPLFAHFKGGKAVATSAGVLLGFSPLFFLYLALIFLVTLYLFSMISLASITASAFAILGILGFPVIGLILPSHDWLFSFFIFLIASLILFRHRENISRIRSKSENCIPWGLNLSQQRHFQKKPPL